MSRVLGGDAKDWLAIQRSYPREGSCAPPPEGSEAALICSDVPISVYYNRAGKGMGFCRYGLQSGTALRPCDTDASSGDGKGQKVTTSDCGNKSAQKNLFVILRVILKSHKPCQHAALGNFYLIIFLHGHFKDELRKGDMDQVKKSHLCLRDPTKCSMFSS